MAPFNSAQANSPSPIVSTLHGTNGKRYFLGQNGHLYFLGAEGNLHEFGTFMPAQSATLNAGQPGSTQPQQQQLQPEQLRDQTRMNATGNGGIAVPTVATPASTMPQSQSALGQQPPLTPQQQQELQQQEVRAETRMNNTASNGIPSPMASSPFNGTAAQTVNTVGVNSGSVTVPNGPGRVNITGTVLATDGKTFFVGSNGFLYYRGQDGALHIVGSGQPE
jgi:hypothetical protein